MTMARWVVIVGLLLPFAAEVCASADGPAVGADPLRPKMYYSAKHGFLITKPDPWVLLTSPEDLERECVGLVIEDSDELLWEEGLAAVMNLTPLEPSGLLAAPFSPRVEVDVYRITTPTDEDAVVPRVVDELVRGLQAIPEMYAQVVAPPEDIQLNGKRWRVVELSAKMRLPMVGEEPGLHDVHTRVEVYAHAERRKLFLVQFVARTFDVPTHRSSVRQIIGSITLVKPPTGPAPIERAQADMPAEDAEPPAETAAEQPPPRSWTKLLWGWWRN
jgi:hypothetical protein